jgi:hypothetical protein
VIPGCTLTSLLSVSRLPFVSSWHRSFSHSPRNANFSAATPSPRPFLAPQANCKQPAALRDFASTAIVCSIAPFFRRSSAMKPQYTRWSFYKAGKYSLPLASSARLSQPYRSSPPLPPSPPSMPQWLGATNLQTMPQLTSTHSFCNTMLACTA